MIKKFFADLIETLQTLDRKPLGELLNELQRLVKREGRLFIIGVGGSAANASHACADFRKLTGIETHSFDNVAEITSRTNDEGWENAYADWLTSFNIGPKDLLLVLSVGGGDKEKNVSTCLIKAINFAREQGTLVAGIVGRDGGYTKEYADICIIIPIVNEYLVTPFVESLQVILLHLLVFHPYLNVRDGKWEGILQKQK